MTDNKTALEAFDRTWKLIKREMTSQELEDAQIVLQALTAPNPQPVSEAEREPVNNTYKLGRCANGDNVPNKLSIFFEELSLLDLPDDIVKKAIDAHAFYRFLVMNSAWKTTDPWQPPNQPVPEGMVLVLESIQAQIKQKQGFYSISVGNSEVRQAHKAGILKGLDAANKCISEAIEACEASLPRDKSCEAVITAKAREE